MVLLKEKALFNYYFCNFFLIPTWLGFSNMPLSYDPKCSNTVMTCIVLFGAQYITIHMSSKKVYTFTSPPVNAVRLICEGCDS